MIEYKGYSGLMEVDPEDGVIAGRVLGIRDVITFEGDTVPQAIQAFHDSVDDYLEFCAERGVAPEKPFSGRFVVRIRPELHRRLAILAEDCRQSLNAFITELLERGTASEPTAKPSRVLEVRPLPVMGELVKGKVVEDPLKTRMKHGEQPKPPKSKAKSRKL